jgi:hypothetical protein
MTRYIAMGYGEAIKRAALLNTHSTPGAGEGIACVI